ncbi:MAG TPA: hypothetical protein VFH08_19960 [Chitinophagaceae bacterium]|nr:hypothetical protein [Chitinophagaceae bacterium]
MKLLLLFILGYCCRLQAQDSTIVVKAGMSINESVSMTDLYQYPQFVYGRVFFMPGDSGAAKLNYNRLLDEMQFIDPKGDTLNIANARTIKFIRINADVFFYDDGYVKLIKDTNGIKLAEKQTLKPSDKTKIGAYGMASPTSAIDSYGTLIDARGVYKLVPREDITLAKKTEYYFGDKYNRFVWATKKNLLQQFPKQGRALNVYLKENNVNFYSIEDLNKLLRFLASL